MKRRRALELPFIDEHAVTIPVPRDLVWTALLRHVAASLSRAEGSRLAEILGTEPRAGFEVSASVPMHRLTLVGRHRFSRYSVDFELTDATTGATELRTQTYAAFPGLQGRAYRALVVGTSLHALAAKFLLRSIRRRSIELAEAG